ncbi:MAG: hypothetical protein Q4B54_03115 [Coriobacteriales bacterium]|nr:hypothetical protein [Coriobacteriales bacterium]
MAGMQSNETNTRDSASREKIEKSDRQAKPSKGGAAVTGALSKAGSTVKGAASGTGRSLAGGLGAMRDVRKATKARQGAQADLKAIKLGLEEDKELLAHRVDVARNYKRIVATQTAAIESAQEESDKAGKAIKDQQRELERLQDELRAMRERHEQELRPYRNLMESSRGRSDDAAKALAASRRSVRSAESAVSDATKRREQRITSAHRSVDNARERLSTVQTELDNLSTNAQGSEAALARVRGELASEQSHLETAQADVVQITQETQSAVDQAQNALWSLQRELATAEKTAEAAKIEATGHKEEYDRHYKAAQAEERAKSDAIKACETRINSLKKTREAAETRARDAQTILDEAHDIHAHPETTQGLRQRIANEERDLADASADLDELSTHERELRRATRKSRAIFIVICVAVLAVLTLILWFAFARPQ